MKPETNWYMESITGIAVDKNTPPMPGRTDSVYAKIKELGHRIGERCCIVWAPYVCVDCGACTEYGNGGHSGLLLENRCTGPRKEPAPTLPKPLNVGGTIPKRRRKDSL